MILFFPDMNHEYNKKPRKTGLFKATKAYLIA